MGLAIATCKAGAGTIPSFACSLNGCSDTSAILTLTNANTIQLRDYQVNSLFDLSNSSAFALTPTTIDAPPGVQKGTSPTTNTSGSGTAAATGNNHRPAKHKYSAGTLAGACLAIGLPLAAAFAAALVFAFRERKMKDRLQRELRYGSSGPHITLMDQGIYQDPWIEQMPQPWYAHMQTPPLPPLPPVHEADAGRRVGELEGARGK